MKFLDLKFRPVKVSQILCTKWIKFPTHLGEHKWKSLFFAAISYLYWIQSVVCEFRFFGCAALAEKLIHLHLFCHHIPWRSSGSFSITQPCRLKVFSLLFDFLFSRLYRGKLSRVKYFKEKKCNCYLVSRLLRSFNFKLVCLLLQKFSKMFCFIPA